MRDLMKDVNYFDEAIQELDALILKGFAILQIAKSAFEKVKDSDEEKRQETLGNHRLQHHQWFDAVYRVIDTNTDRKYYLIHFVNVNRTAMSLSGMSPEQSDFIVSFEVRLTALKEVLQMLEERRSVIIRQEIAKQERDQSVKYELRYSSSRELTLNGILLAKPDFHSENDQFLSFIFTDGNSWRTVPMQELLENLATDKLKKTVHQILADVGIVDNLKTVFMPNVSTKAIQFRNPITHGFAEENKLPEITITKTVRTNKK